MTAIILATASIVLFTVVAVSFRESRALSKSVNGKFQRFIHSEE